MLTGTAISKKAEGAVLPHRLLIAGSTDGLVTIAVDATKPILGPSIETGSDADCVVEFFLDKVPYVEYGGNVTYGDKLTSDSVGRAIATTTAGNNVIGIAMVSGVIGDLGEVLIDRAIA